MFERLSEIGDRLSTGHLLLALGVAVAVIVLGAVVWQLLPISCPSQPEWWMVGC